MQIEEKIAVNKRDMLQTLYRKREFINNEIGKLVSQRKKERKNDPESKVVGSKYYYYTPFIPGQPRVTVAAHVNAEKMELYYGVVVTNSKDQFCKRTGRLKAMGKAVSTKRSIMRLKSTNHKYVREVIGGLGHMAFVQSKSKRREGWPEERFLK